MKKESFLKAIGSVITMFPQKQIDVNIMYECLQDLADDQFKKAVIKTLNETERIDASTNLIAVIRKNASKDVRPVDTRPGWMIEAMKVGKK